jgi:hypothetical protein
LPRKAKEVEKPFALKHWRPITAVASVLVLLSGLGVYATENYNQAQTSIAAGKALEAGENKIKEITGLLDELEQTIRDADQIAFEAEGRTLDDESFNSLVAEIEQSKQVWVDQKTKLLELEAAVEGLIELRQSDGRWPNQAEAYSEFIQEIVASDWNPITAKISSILEKSSSTKVAQGKWLKEQDRIAAEKAAAEAAAKAAADDLARKSTEPTGITIVDPLQSVDVCTVTPLESSATKQEIANYIFNLAPNAQTTWACGICMPGTFCGKAFVPLLEEMYPGFVGPPQTEKDATVVIVFDENHLELYLTDGGRSILVHEAAHARQHLKYGTTLISSNASYRGLPEGYTKEQGIAAVEFMADCATIVKLGYSTGAYTQTCSPEELAAAATIW